MIERKLDISRTQDLLDLVSVNEEVVSATQDDEGKITLALEADLCNGMGIDLKTFDDEE